MIGVYFMDGGGTLYIHLMYESITYGYGRSGVRVCLIISRRINNGEQWWDTRQRNILKIHFSFGLWTATRLASADIVVSLTRCWNKNSTIFLEKLPKKKTQKFLLKKCQVSK